MMKKTFFVLMFFSLLLCCRLQAQSNGGRTYYDAAQMQLKETFMLQNINGHSVKNGSYFMYYTNGKLEISGSYKNDQKDGEWKYYDASGKLIKTENYSAGKRKD